MIGFFFDVLWDVAIFGWFALGIREALRFGVLVLQLFLTLVAAFDRSVR